MGDNPQTNMPPDVAATMNADAGISMCPSCGHPNNVHMPNKDGGVVCAMCGCPHQTMG